MRGFVERYWVTVSGFAVIAACIVGGVASVGSNTVHDIVETSLTRKAERFAELLNTLPEATDALLTGLARNPDQESEIRRIATLDGIESFAVFAADGRETFRSRSDRYAWLLRDRAGGITSDNRLSQKLLDREIPASVVNDDGSDMPSAIVPLARGGRTIGYVSVVADLTHERGRYALALAEASMKILLILLVTTGVPLLFHVRRKHKIAEADARIQFLANHDPLTRLLNRRRMQEEVDRVIVTARAMREPLAYCCIDIDGLSEINDMFGQAQGDELLRVVASRLSSVVDRNDLLGRIAADDFVLFHRRAGDDEDMARLAHRLRSTISEPVELSGQIVRPRISIGVATMPRDGKTQGDLVKHAQLALAHHKLKPGGDYVGFEPFMDEETDRRRQIETLVRTTIETAAFELAYQPIVSGDGKRLLGFEALLRMPDGLGGYVSPAVFVPIAEARGYIKEIGTWVIREAARQASQWPEHLFIAVNLSAVQFRDGDLVEIVENAITAAGIPGSRIEMEVVESLVLDRSESVLAQLRGLKALGISIDMDDFGTGYSSLGYLWKFPFDKLKIDRSFMVAFDDGEANVPEIIGTIISLAHRMRMKVTAEGVENQAQADLLESLGCDQIQGYLYGKPMPADNVAADVLKRFAKRFGAAEAAPSPTRSQMAESYALLED